MTVDAPQDFLKGTSVSREELSTALRYAARMRRVLSSDSAEPQTAAYLQMRTVHTLVVKRVYGHIRDDADSALMRPVAETAFELARSLPPPQEPLDKAAQQVNLGCYAVLGDRWLDFSSELADPVIPENLLVAEDWGARVRAVSVAMWLHLLRNRDQSDLIEAKELYLDMCKAIEQYEPRYLAEVGKPDDPRPPAYLAVHHNHCEVAEILIDYLAGNAPEAGIDIGKRVAPHFEQAEYAANVATLFDGLCITKLLERIVPEILPAAQGRKARAAARKRKILQARTSRKPARRRNEQCESIRILSFELVPAYAGAGVDIDPSYGRTS